MSDLNERLDKVRELLKDPDFLESRGLSNEVNIRIFCYHPQDEMIIQHFVRQIMTDQTLPCHLLERNLYKIFLKACEEKRACATDCLYRLRKRSAGVTTGKRDSGAVLCESDLRRFLRDGRCPAAHRRWRCISVHAHS